ncbi:MAG: hypothetical protein ABIQ11_10515 [Saprospiraceae bacterium]
MKILRLIAVAALFYNALGALAGGWGMMADPSGQDLQLSLSYLDHTPFHNYLYPGIILFMVNGVFCLVVLMATLFKWKHHELLIMAQGALLTGWIIIQITMIQLVYYLHYISVLMGLFLIFYGILAYFHKKSGPNEGNDKLRYSQTH